MGIDATIEQRSINMSMNRATDVAIIGGGVIGCSIASININNNKKIYLSYSHFSLLAYSNKGFYTWDIL